MMKPIIYTAFTIVAALAAGCSPYSKLLKTENYDLQYRTAVEYVATEKYQKALTLFEKVNMHYMGSERADSILYYTGLAHYKMGNFETSAMAFDDFRKRYDRSPFIEDAEYMYAKGFYYSSSEPDRDQSTTIRALSAIGEYISRYPNSEKREALEENITELTQKLHDKAYLNARTYYKIGRYKSAIVALQNAIDDYPTSTHREELMYMMVKSSYEYARNSMETLRRDRYLDMMDFYLTYISEFPDGKYAKELGRLQNNAKNYIARIGEGEIVEIEIEK